MFGNILWKCFGYVVNLFKMCENVWKFSKSLKKWEYVWNFQEIVQKGYGNVWKLLKMCENG